MAWNIAFADSWTGNIDENWFNALNWASNTVPNSSTDITIDNPAVNSPNITTGNALAHDIALGLTAFGSGTLNIATGGKLSANSVNLGSDTNSSGTIIVSDANSMMNLAGNLVVGDNASGTLNILNGAIVNTATASIGAQADSSGTVVMVGSGTQWNNSNDLIVGDQGVATLVLVTGAVLHDTDSIVSNQNPLGSGSVTIASAGTQWINSGNLTIANGIDTFADLDISDGAEVDAVNTILANQTGSFAIVSLENTGTVWNNNSLVIGQSGTAIVTLSDSATLNVTGNAGVVIGSGSVLNVGGADGSPAVAGGQLNTPNIFLNNTAAIFFNHTDIANTVNANISGAGAITQEGSGTTILNGNNSYTGGTTVSAGTLQGTTSGLQGSILNNSHIVFDQNNNGVFTGTLSGSGDLTKLGIGSVTFTNAMAYTGNTLIGQGTLQAAAADILLNTPMVSITKNAAFNLAGFPQTLNNLQNNGTIILSSNNSAQLAPNTLVINNDFSGNGSIQMNADLIHRTNDLISISGLSSGQQHLLLTNTPQNVDPVPDTTLKLVQTSDGIASFIGGIDAGTFEYIVSRGNNSVVAPDPHAWYLVRLDLLESGVAIKDVLTSTATASIGTYSALIPLFYSDLQTLMARMGDLRLGNNSGAWIRTFGNKMQLDNQISRPFNQNSGGIEGGIDKGFNGSHGHINLGVYADYLYAARQFHQNATGATQSMSLGFYATWLHLINGCYVDIVAKYSEYWNDFQATTLSGLPSNANFHVPAVGGSIEAGKKIIFATRHEFFIEPQFQLTTVWFDQTQYHAGNGLQIHGNDQTSVLGRVGLRSGMEFTLNNHRVIEPYLQIALLQEFNKYNTVTTNSTSFHTQLPQTVKRFGAGIATKLAPNMFLYGDYYYAVGQNFREPVAVNIGLRWSL
jgi:outer membrane autotransporter protein